MLFHVVLHGGPIISRSQSFSCEGSFAEVLDANTLVDFEQDTIHTASVDALDKGNGKSSPIKFSLDQDVRASSLSDNGRFFRVIEEFSFSEVIVYGGHPATIVPDGEHL